MSKNNILPIEVIKWGCEIAEGFELDQEELIMRYSYGDFVHDHQVSIIEKSIVYHLFLQKVIEGINREYWNKFYLQQDDIGVHYIEYPDLKIKETFLLSAYDFDIDTCKTQAIQYIYDHREDL